MSGRGPEAFPNRLLTGGTTVALALLMGAGVPGPRHHGVARFGPAAAMAAPSDTLPPPNGAAAQPSVKPTMSAPSTPTPSTKAAPTTSGSAARTTTVPASAKATARVTPTKVSRGAGTSGSKPAAAARAVPVSGTVRSASSATTSRTTNSAMAPREERVTYHYNALGRRDPFKQLIGGFVGDDVGGNAPPDVGGIKVVGIVWGAEDKFALVEDPRGNSLVLRRGDKVMNGFVENLRRDAVIVKLTVDGQTELVAIPLTRKGESNENH